MKFILNPYSLPAHGTYVTTSLAQCIITIIINSSVSDGHQKLQGFNATLTEPVDTPGRRGGDQIKEMDLKLHLELKGPLTALCNDPKTTIVVLSGSNRSVLDHVLHSPHFTLNPTTISSSEQCE